MNTETIVTVISAIEGVLATIAAVLVLYELKTNQINSQQQGEIEEADFILRYNQAFIQDDNMTEVEHLLEEQNIYGKTDPNITPENRQSFINYLVYLEGMAPLILKGILSFDDISDLFAYRYFMAMHNTELQKKELIPFKEFYKGCFKIYKPWKDYLLKNNEKIPCNNNSLDTNNIINCYMNRISNPDVSISKISDNDSFRNVAKIIMQTDDYIYPDAFSNPKAIEYLMEENNSLFGKDNIFVLRFKQRPVSVAVVLNKDSKTTIKIDTIRYLKANNLIASTFDKVNEEYFSKFTTLGNDSAIQIVALATDKQYHNKNYASMLMCFILDYYEESDFELEVLANNEIALHIYESLGFTKEQSKNGYPKEQKFEVYEMKRKH